MFFLTLVIYAQDKKIELKTDLQDVPPKYVKNQSGSTTGICFEIMKLVESKSNYRFKHDDILIPLKRVTAYLEKGDSDIQFGIQKTAERQKIMTFGAELFKIKIVGVVRADDDINIKTISDIVKLDNAGTVLTPHGTATAASLKKIKGLIIDDNSPDFDTNLNKLLAKRARILIYHNLSVNYELRNPKFAGKFKVINIDFEGNGELGDADQYIVYSKKVPENIRKDIDRIIEEAKAKKEIDKITSKYLN